MGDKDLTMDDVFLETRKPSWPRSQPKLLSPIQHCGHRRSPRSNSPISDMDLDDFSCISVNADASSGQLKCACLILRCTNCLNVVLIEYSEDNIPGRLRSLGLSQRSNGIALTTCKKCLSRIETSMEGRDRGREAQFYMERTTGLCPTLWSASEFFQATALVLEERVELMMVDRVGLHIKWDRISRAMTPNARVVSLDITQVITGDAKKIMLPYLSGNWI